MKLMESKFLVKLLHSCCHCHWLGTKYRLALCGGCYCMLHLVLLPRIGPLVLCPRWPPCQGVVHSQWTGQQSHLWPFLQAISGASSLLTVFQIMALILSQGQFCPSGNIWHCLEPFLLLQLGERYNWHLVGRHRNGDKHPTTYRQGSPQPHPSKLLSGPKWQW